jgi:hypothetical protein
LAQRLLPKALRQRLAQLQLHDGDGDRRRLQRVPAPVVALRLEGRRLDGDAPAQLQEQSPELFSRAPIAL